MKLYATITSERASKGQGGNYLEIAIYNEDKRKTHYITVGDGVLCLYGNNPLTNFDGPLLYRVSLDACPKCGVVHDVEIAGGHDLIEAEKVLICEC